MKWISVKDRLPDIDVPVLVTDGKEVTAQKMYMYPQENPVNIGWSDHASGWECEPLIEVVTHWMPLPEPPEDER